MVELDNFRLEEFDINNEEHVKVVEDLDKDEMVKKIFGTMMISIEYTKGKYLENGIDAVYTVYYNNESIGMIMLNLVDDKSYEISYAILPKYRGEYLASLLLQEFSERIFEVYPYVEELNLLISSINKASIKVANRVGYIKNGASNYYTMKR